MLGVLELVKPWREQPAAETLCDPDGRLSARSIAQRMLRALEREGRADPGAARVVARCAPEVASAAAPFVGRLGPRFAVESEADRERLGFETRTL